MAISQLQRTQCIRTFQSASYPVSLTAADGGGSNTTTRANYINVSAALPIPVFTGTPTSGHAPLSVQFNDTTQGTGIQVLELVVW